LQSERQHVNLSEQKTDDVWNSLPRQLKGIAVASTFKHHLKSELFFQAYGVSTIASTIADPRDCLHY